MQDFLNLAYENGMIPTISKPARVTRKIATAIDHILTNAFVDRTFKSGIYKTHGSDHLPVIFLIPSVNLLNKDKTSCICKRFVADEAITAYNISFYGNNWKEILECENVNEPYTTILDRFSKMYAEIVFKIFFLRIVN